MILCKQNWKRYRSDEGSICKELASATVFKNDFLHYLSKDRSFMKTSGTLNGRTWSFHVFEIIWFGVYEILYMTQSLNLRFILSMLHGWEMIEKEYSLMNDI